MLLKIMCDDATFRVNTDKIPENSVLYKTVFENQKSDFLFYSSADQTLYADMDPQSMRVFVDHFRGYPMTQTQSEKINFDAMRLNITLSQQGGGDIQYDSQVDEIFQQLNISPKRRNDPSVLDDPAIEKVIKKFNDEFDISSTVTEHPFNKLSEELKNNGDMQDGGGEISATSDYMSEFTTEYRRMR